MEPDTIYEFKIEYLLNYKQSKIYRFKTLPQDFENLKVAFVGSTPNEEVS